MREHTALHPDPDQTVEWYEAFLDGKMPGNRVLLRRVLKLAKLGAASEAGQTAKKNARDAYWTHVVEECEHFLAVGKGRERGRRAACRMAARILDENADTIRGVVGSSPQSGLTNLDS